MKPKRILPLSLLHTFTTSLVKGVFVFAAMRRFSRVFVALILLALPLFFLTRVGTHVPTAYAATSDNLNFQARLQSAAGAIVPDGFYNVEFKLYDASSGGTLLWTETRYDSNGVTAGNDNRVRVVNGYLTVNLGDITSFPGTMPWDQQLYLTMNVGGTTHTATPTYDGEMSPRLKMTAVPYAFNAKTASQLVTTNGALTSSLSIQGPTVGSQTFVIQDQGAAGTYNLLTENQIDAGYIQNQNAGQQATSNLWISGTARADTSVLTPLLDTATATDLNIGTTNATAINLNENTTVAAGKNVTFAAGAGNFDQSASSGTFSTGTGAVSLNGDTTVASGKNLTVTSGTTSLTGTTNINTTGTGTTTIGSVTGGAVNITANAASNLTTNTGALTLTSAAATTWSTTAGALTLQGAAGATITSANGTTSSAVTITTGNASAGASGAISLDTGTATTTAGTISIGTANASAVTIGRATVTTTIQGSLSISPQASTSTTLLCTNAGVVSTCDAAVLAPTATNFIQNQNASQQTGNYWISGTARADTSVLSPLYDTASAVALNIGTTTATSITIGRAAIATTLASSTINLGTTGANTTLQGATQGTLNTAGNGLMVQGSTGNGTGAGGTLTIKGGTGGATNANGGNVVISGGTATGTGTQGLVTFSTSAFTSATTQSFGATGNLTAGLVDQYSTVPVSATATGVTVTIPAPAAINQVVGRILYLANVGSNDFNILLTGTSINISLKPNSTATLIWNGTGWTAAGASSSTDLQSAYNNTLTSAGGAELVLNQSGGAADGLTIRNNGTAPITGGILEVQSSIGTNLFSVNNAGIELAANGGAETSSSFGTDWTAAPVSATIARSTTAGEFSTGQAGVRVTTTSTAFSGVRNNLSGNPVVSTTYTVSFTAKSSINGTPIDVLYTRNGGTNTVACTDYGTGVAYATLSNTVWTKVTCTITTDATGASNPDLFIRKTDGSAPIVYIDNLSFIRNDSSTQPSNVQIGGGISGGQVTLFTLDRSSSPPVANGDSTYFGSMYYDTTSGRIQCYESDGWGACGSAPDNIVVLTPEYSNAVLNGTGVGTMTADFCANQGGVLTVGSLCASGIARNFYKWTSPQPTAQTYSVYVSYKLPSTFKNFYDSGTIKLTGYRDHGSNANLQLSAFRSTGSAISQCGSTTQITTGTSTWDTISLTGTDETTCGFQAGEYVIFRIDVTSQSNANVYVENLEFRYTNT